MWFYFIFNFILVWCYNEHAIPIQYLHISILRVYRNISSVEAEALKAKGGDYAKETARIVNSTLAENGVAYINVNVSGEFEKWDCSCGKKDITSNFCPDCGSKKK